jgi:hypothetical protein
VNERGVQIRKENIRKIGLKRSSGQSIRQARFSDDCFTDFYSRLLPYDDFWPAKNDVTQVLSGKKEVLTLFFTIDLCAYFFHYLQKMNA